MVKNSKKDDTVISIIIGIIILLPIIILSLFFYKKLSKNFLNSDNLQRVSDIKRLLIPISLISSILIGYSIVCYIGIYEFKINNVSKILLFSIPIMFSSYFFAKYLAIIYLGIVFDFDKDIIICPYDFESYGITDYLTFRFIKSFTEVNCINVNELTKVTRGYGNQLYLHGKFGSNKIIMSSKQKRDECLAFITELIKKKGIILSEIESY